MPGRLRQIAAINFVFRVKRAVEKLRAAELLATLVSLKYPAFMANHATARGQAFQDLGLYWEHDWTADGPVTRPQRAGWHDLLAARIDYYVNSIHGEALIRLGGMIPRPDKIHQPLLRRQPPRLAPHRRRRPRPLRLRRHPRPRPCRRPRRLSPNR